MLFNHFSSYPTFQVFLGFIVAAALTMVIMPAWIKLLKRTHVGQQVRADGPESHLVKQGTPTMGGVIMLVAVIITTLLVATPSLELASALVATILIGALGLFDDASKVVHERSLGLTPKGKLIGQFTVSVLFTLVVVNVCHVAPTVQIPFLPVIDLGVLTTTLPIGMSNVVNLTDGLYGLAAGTVMVSMLVMGAIAYASDILPLAVFGATIAGACVGFLWFNAYPADIFMGDTGSLALGMALGCIAMITKTEIVSLIIGGLFVAEALSVVIQVLHYRRTHTRIFLMAPLHHHFEKKGWSEVKVVIRFWIISAVLAGIGFSIFFIQPFVS